jgi:hypothetical protein
MRAKAKLRYLPELGVLVVIEDIGSPSRAWALSG